MIKLALHVTEGKAPTRAPFTKMASLPTNLSDPDLKMDFNKVPPSPKLQLEEGTTGAPDADELLGYEQTAAQKASPEVRAGPPPSRASAIPSVSRE